MKYILSLTLYLLSVSSQAAFINEGDYTTDDITGLNWLDLSYSTNKSLEDALLANPGYQAASLEQVQTLFTHAFSSLDGTMVNNILFDNPSVGYTESLLFISLFSATKGPPNGTYGLVGDSLELFSANIEFENVEVNVATNINGIMFENKAHQYMGWYLIQGNRDQREPDQRVPEPTSLAIFAAGLFALTKLRRRNLIKANN